MSTANRKRRKELRQFNRELKHFKPFDSYLPTLEELDRRRKGEWDSLPNVVEIDWNFRDTSNAVESDFFVPMEYYGYIDATSREDAARGKRTLIKGLNPY